MNRQRAHSYLPNLPVYYGTGDTNKPYQDRKGKHQNMNFSRNSNDHFYLRAQEIYSLYEKEGKESILGEEKPFKLVRLKA